MLKKSQKIIVGNWKMNPSSAEEARRIFLSAKKQALKLKNIFIVVCPPFIYLQQCKKLFIGDYIALGGQNICKEHSGSFTGEISVNMLKNIGAEYCIIGHSERRAMGETNEIVALKNRVALSAGLKVVLCVGEKERDINVAYLDFLKNQIKESLYKVERKYIKDIIIAYEPIWAIGSKEAMTPSDIYEMTIFIKKTLSDIYGQEEALKVRVIYGGAVTFRNAEDIIVEGKVDGLLVGHESVNQDGFRRIVKTINEIN
ncbi:MAG: triose-phosphate isomerase [Patescibacteria group bacterium]|nr:triose-phosphate isomerase [Patescibacteria group bacterium]